MKLLTGKYLKGFIGVMLFCIFAMKFCSVFVNSIAVAKHHLSTSKSIDDVKDDTKEGDADDKDSEDTDAEKFGKLVPEFNISHSYEHTFPAQEAAETVTPLYIPKAIKEPLLAVPTLPPDVAIA